MRRATQVPATAEVSPEGQDRAGGPGPAAGRRRIALPLMIAVATALAVAVLASGYAIIRHRQQSLYSMPRPSGIPASVSTSLALSMQLSPVPDQPAPAFTLTDQDGRAISLASLRGHAVVLEFMDPHCTDLCPIVSAEFLAAYHDLGAAGKRAIFIAVNVNPYYRSVADVSAYSAGHYLTTIPSWHFLTGPLASLRAVWAAYQVEVQAPSRPGDIIHTSLVYFIDPGGRERFVAIPMDDHTAAGKAYLPAADQAAWGRGIALVTHYLAG